MKKKRSYFDAQTKRFVELTEADKAQTYTPVPPVIPAKIPLRDRLKMKGLIFVPSFKLKSGVFSLWPALLITIRKGDCESGPISLSPSSIVFGPKYIIDFYFLTMHFCVQSRVWGVIG